MRLVPSDPDIETLVRRMKNGEINLQPDFQRGEVWTTNKKRRLIDSVLRNWHVPPVHIIFDEETGGEEVLDGQQRLVAIRDFVEGKFRIDGNAMPEDADILALDNLRYDQLPPRFRKRFDNFTIRVFRLTDFSPDEPAELFFRLNQPTNLTAAEQRNAFFGPARGQIKELVDRFPEFGLTPHLLGFSNSRMAYDDILARACFSLSARTLREKITASGINEQYRSREPYPPWVVEDLEFALQMFGSFGGHLSDGVRFNKATVYTWLIFLVKARHQGLESDPHGDVATFVNDFELLRARVKNSSIAEPASVWWQSIPWGLISGLLSVFNDRATSRVADISSVLLRDLVVWYAFYSFTEMTPQDLPDLFGERRRLLQDLDTTLTTNLEIDEIERALDETLMTSTWGAGL